MSTKIPTKDASGRSTYMCLCQKYMHVYTLIHVYTYTRSSSREVRIRAPFSSVVYFRGNPPHHKRLRKGTIGGPSIYIYIHTQNSHLHQAALRVHAYILGRWWVNEPWVQYCEEERTGYPFNINYQTCWCLFAAWRSTWGSKRQGKR